MLEIPIVCVSNIWGHCSTGILVETAVQKRHAEPCLWDSYEGLWSGQASGLCVGSSPTVDRQKTNRSIRLAHSDA